MKKKLLTAAVLTIAAIALVVATVFTTVAYLTSSSAVTNTFTVGNVGIELYESPVDTDGKKDPAVTGKKTSNGNNYHLLPGKTYDKDPTVYINSGSDTSYLFVKVRNTIVDIEQGNFVHTGGVTNVNDEKPTIHRQMLSLGWVLLGPTSTGDVYVYAPQHKTNADSWGSPVGGTTNIDQVDVFHTFTVDEHADVSLYGGAKVNITAFAIQTAGFAGDVGSKTAVTAAWNAIVETYPYESGAINSDTVGA